MPGQRFYVRMEKLFMYAWIFYLSVHEQVQKAASRITKGCIENYKRLRPELLQANKRRTIVGLEKFWMYASILFYEAIASYRFF